jgi:hypothetical protein
MAAECHATVTVNLGVGMVWDLITDSSKFHALRIPGTYGPFDPVHARAGTRFEYQSLFGGPRYPRYIVEWIPRRVFAFGNSPNEWAFRWELTPGPRTHAHFTRRFANLTLWERLFKSQEVWQTYQGLTQATVDSLEGACRSLSEGGGDGLTRSPW